MSIDKIHLRKLLMLFYAPNSLRTAKLREDIRTEIGKERGQIDGGGDFHVPFWSDVKKFVAGEADLKEQSKLRIDNNKGRERLYPQLTEKFLNWWEEKRRWRNEVFELVPNSDSAQVPFPDHNATVKVENLLTVKIGGNIDRVVYPYFSESPPLPGEGARLGLWLLGEALRGYHLDDFRILDILRSTSFRTADYPLQGNERELFIQKYDLLLREWEKLKEEYE